MIEVIKAKVGGAELLAELAEEAVELAHAALKLRRVIDGKNPTPVNLGDAFDNLEEEVADVLVCLEVLGYDLKELLRYRAMMDAKLARWAARLSATTPGTREENAKED